MTTLNEQQIYRVLFGEQGHNAYPLPTLQQARANAANENALEPEGVVSAVVTAASAQTNQSIIVADKNAVKALIVEVYDAAIADQIQQQQRTAQR